MKPAKSGWLERLNTKGFQQRTRNSFSMKSLALGKEKPLICLVWGAVFILCAAIGTRNLETKTYGHSQDLPVAYLLVRSSSGLHNPTPPNKTNHPWLPCFFPMIEALRVLLELNLWLWKSLLKPSRLKQDLSDLQVFTKCMC